jgi:THO complex subunit 4
MQTPYSTPPNVRHGGKRQLLGNPAANIPPAWKVNTHAMGKENSQEESKILLSRLPADVGGTEVEASARTERWV